MHVLGVELPGFPDPVPAPWIVDQYARRRDLIATYERPAPDHLRCQVYWRYVWEEASGETDVAGRVDGVHLIVSVQTNRLDLRPTITVVSDIPTDHAAYLISPDQEVWTTLPAIPTPQDPPAGGPADGKAALWLVRLPRNNRSIVMMVLPNDLVAIRVTRQEPCWRYAFDLLDEHLEKGVIRRAQVAAWFVPREVDEIWARKLYLQLLTAPPPLTT